MVSVVDCKPKSGSECLVRLLVILNEHFIFQFWKNPTIQSLLPIGASCWHLFSKYKSVQAAEKPLWSVSTKCHETCICPHFFSQERLIRLPCVSSKGERMLEQRCSTAAGSSGKRHQVYLPAPAPLHKAGC